jgi:hypothetical protein
MDKKTIDILLPNRNFSTPKYIKFPVDVLDEFTFDGELYVLHYVVVVEKDCDYYDTDSVIIVLSHSAGIKVTDFKDYGFHTKTNLPLLKRKSKKHLQELKDKHGGDVQERIRIFKEKIEEILLLT